jgi:hypothetical protein
MHFGCRRVIERTRACILGAACVALKVGGERLNALWMMQGLKGVGGAGGEGWWRRTQTWSMQEQTSVTQEFTLSQKVKHQVEIKLKSNHQDSKH